MASKEDRIKQLLARYRQAWSIAYSEVDPHESGMNQFDSHGAVLKRSLEIEQEVIATILERYRPISEIQAAIPADLIAPMLEMTEWVREHSEYFESRYGDENFARVGSIDLRIQEYLESLKEKESDE